MVVHRRRRLNKSGLIQAVAYKSGQPADDCADIVNAAIDVIEGVLNSGGSVQLHGFGRFYPAAVRSSTSFDPTRKAYVERPGRLQVRFKPGRRLTQLSAAAEPNLMSTLVRGASRNG